MLAAVYLTLAALPLGHITDIPHSEPLPVEESGSAPATVVILVGVVLTLATLAALIYLKQKMAARDDEQSE